MKSNIFISSETMEDSLHVSSILLQVIKEKQLDAEIVSVVNGRFPDSTAFCTASGSFSTIAIPDPNQRPFHIGNGSGAIYNLATEQVTPTLVCSHKNCNEPEYEFGECFKHYCISEHK